MTTTPPAASTADRVRARVRLRPTMSSDLGFVLSLEQDPENLPYVTAWERTQHEAAIRFPDFRHFIIEGGADYEPVGYVILIGARSQHQVLELKRMVVNSKGHGFGRATMREVKRIAFGDLKAHRLWLDVRTVNTRAKALYDSEGFQVEGLLRECVRTDEGFASLVVMGMLQPEFAARRAQGLED